MRQSKKNILTWGLLFLTSIGTLFSYPLNRTAYAACASPPSDLVSWWDGDSVIGTVATDIQDSNDGTLKNGTTTTSGQVGDAFSFDEADDYIDLGTGSNLAPSNYSILAWINIDILPGSADADVIFANGDASSDGFYFRVVGLLYKLNITHSAVGSVLGTTALTAGSFRHVAVTYNGTTAKIYLDGALDGSGALAAYNSPPTLSAKIGASGLDGGLYIDGLFDGLIDEVEFYNRELTSAEVLAAYSAGIDGHCKPSAVPEFRTYVYLLTFLLAGGLMFKRLRPARSF